MTQFLSAGGAGGEEGERRNIQRFALTPTHHRPNPSLNTLMASKRCSSEAQLVTESVLGFAWKGSLHLLARHLEHFGPWVWYCLLSVHFSLLAHLLNAYLRGLDSFTSARVSTDTLLFLSSARQNYKPNRSVLSLYFFKMANLCY